MRAAGPEYLPKHAREPADAYSERLNTSVLYPGFTQTLELLASKPFETPLQLVNPPGYIQTIAKNVDGFGSSLNVFCRNWFKEGLAKGAAYVLLEDASDRPYWSLLSPDDVIDVRSVYQGELRTVTHLRYYRTQRAYSGFAEASVETIRELNATPEGVKLTIWTKNQRGVWIASAPTDAGMPAIGLIEFCAGATPPLRDLAFLNAAHWQCASDQQAIMRVARMPVLAVSGQIGDDGDEEVVIGPHSFLKLPDPNARAFYVEHSGAAIQSGRQELLDLQDDMAAFGQYFLRRKSGNISATARALDEAALMAPIGVVAKMFEAAVALALAYTDQFYTGAGQLTTDAGGTVKLEVSTLSDADASSLDALTKAYTLNAISRETYLAALVGFGVLPDDFDEAKDRAARDRDLPGASA